MAVRLAPSSQISLHFRGAVVALLLLTSVLADPFAGQELTPAQIVEQQAPSVVTITTEDGFGSGVIVDPTGRIVTNFHVIQGGRSAEVKLSNGDVYDEILVSAIDRRRDLALIRIRGFGLPAASFGDSELVRPGDSVILVGAPEGLEQTVSNGIVSALRDSGDGYRFIQTTAPASPGSSGGGMFNEAGELIGIVTSQFTAGQNLNFAVPINYARGLMAVESEMTLADAAVRYPPEGSVAPSAAIGSDPVGATPNEAQLRTAVETSGLSYQNLDDDTWSIEFSNGTYLDNVTVFVSVFADMVLFQAAVAAQPTLTHDLAVNLLSLNWEQNLVKFGLDTDGDLRALQELPLAIVDGETVNRIANAVAVAADEAAGALAAPSDLRRSTDLTFRSTGRETDVIEVLGGAAMIRYDASNWEEQATEIAGGRQFFNESEAFFVTLIEETSQFPIESMPDIALANARESGAEVMEVGRGKRDINGREFSFIEYNARVSGFDVTYLGLFYSDASGTLQIVGWSTTNIFESTRGKVEQFASGFFVTPAARATHSTDVASHSEAGRTGEVTAQ